MIYVTAVLCALFVAYLVHDFYQEQLRERLIPVRAQIRSAVRRVRRPRAR